MLDNRDKQTIVALLAVGLIARLVYFLEYRSLIEFLHPTVDALYHHLTAKAIAGGALVSSEPFFRAPFYNYFLGLIYYFTNDSIAAARFIQLMIGTLTAPMVYLLGRKVFDRRVGLMAAVLVLLTGDIVYFEGELVLEATAMWLILLSLLLFVKYIKEPRVMTLVLMAATTGLAIIDRPNAFVLVPIFVWGIWKSNKAEKGRELLKRALIFTAVLMIPVGLVVLHNATRSQPAVTIATQGGVNFYIGNNEAADGVSAVIPGKLGYSWQYADIEYAAETEKGSPLSPSEVSSYYFGKGLSFIASDPARWLGLAVRKTYLIFSGEEISNNRNLRAFKSEFGIFKVLLIGMRALAPLGLVGMICAFRRTKGTEYLAIFVLGYALSFVLFFVNSRFRLPLLPILAIFAAFLLIEVVRWMKQRNWRALRAPVITVIVLTATLNANLYGIQFDNRQQASFNKGNLYLESGDYTRAIMKYYEALAIEPPLKQVHLNLGIAFLRTGQLDSAWHHFLVEDSLFEGSAEALNNLAYLYRQTGQTNEAIIAAGTAVDEKPYLPEARLNLWYALRESGRADSAYTLIRLFAAKELLNNSEKFILAISAIDLQKFAEADTLLQSILSGLRAKRVPSYSEASNASANSGRLAPALFESRVLYNLGLVRASQGEIDNAIDFLSQSVENDPNLAEGWTNLGSAYFSKRDLPKAIAAFEKARQLTPESEVVLFNLAISYLTLGESEKAREAAVECLRLHPDFRPARELLKSIETTQK
ncbi:MAG: tetratricopeptide repeat protein [Candidatus Zixiibacteriota bacterium]